MWFISSCFLFWLRVIFLSPLSSAVSLATTRDEPFLTTSFEAGILLRDSNLSRLTQVSILLSAEVKFLQPLSHYSTQMLIDLNICCNTCINVLTEYCIYVHLVIKLNSETAWVIIRKVVLSETWKTHLLRSGHSIPLISSAHWNDAQSLRPCLKSAKFMQGIDKEMLTRANKSLPEISKVFINNKCVNKKYA